MNGITQKFEKGLCPNAEYLQKRMICMKTNYGTFRNRRTSSYFKKDFE